ncbi:Ubiquitin carboxyl-terminal hydrolase family protein, putative [Theobroma cacao]|uniref:Ubiquitin carboxyl-terminal hydrolase family protein, putative n=1 Tax=Theobroma cacao TaxID=3641 RepID=A0A061EYZ7_THECC|nr:Ubiquitin carboxyl-terminal hydrolase family protein, putative [Theobroma cacao]
MFFQNSNSKTHFKKLIFISKFSIISPFNHQKPPFRYSQNHNYVNVYMKWKKDPFFDSTVHIHKSIELKLIIQLKNLIAKDPNGCIPISAVSKRGEEFDISIKIARFLRQYPSVFEEFRGPEYILPWFRLTQKLLRIIERRKGYLRNARRIRRIGFLEDSKGNVDESFTFMDMEDELKGLAVESEGEKGLRLKRKIEGWLKEFQKLPYVSPYEDFSHLDRNSDAAERRVEGILHELLSLFVEHSAQRKKLLCLKKYFELPQKVHKAFERHPHMFYLSFKNKTCTAILKEAYCGKSSMERHPLLGVRKKYIRLVKESGRILKNSRINNRFIKQEKVEKDLDMDSESDDRTETLELTIALKVASPGPVVSEGLKFLPQCYQSFYFEDPVAAVPLPSEAKKSNKNMKKRLKEEYSIED